MAISRGTVGTFVCLACVVHNIIDGYHPCYCSYPPTHFSWRHIFGANNHTISMRVAYVCEYVSVVGERNLASINLQYITSYG